MLFLPIAENYGMRGWCSLCRRKISQPHFYVTQRENDPVNASSDLQFQHYLDGRRETVRDPGTTSAPILALYTEHVVKRRVPPIYEEDCHLRVSKHIYWPRIYLINIFFTL
jgi:hypothetical protein